MNTNITPQQKLLLGIVLAVLAILLIFFFAIKPVFNTHTQLQQKIHYENELHDYLLEIRKQISSDKVLPTLTPNEAKNLINKTIKVRKTVRITNENIEVTLKKQEFNTLINNIYTLKTQYGIVATKASITKVDEGLVDATLNFSHL